MAHVPKYEKVKALILADIRSGVYQAGDRIPTREQLVEKYSVTRTTIGQALKILVNAGVLATSKRGGTVVTGKSMPLKVAVVSSLGKSPENDIIKAVEAESFGVFRPIIEAGIEFDLEFIDINNLTSAKLNWITRYDCAVFVMPNDEILFRLSDFKDNTIVINRYSDEFNFIATNHRQAVFEMTEYNLDGAGSGCQVFFLDNAEHDDFVCRERREGFVDACEKANKFYRLCDLPLSGYDAIFDALMQIDFEENKNIVMVSPYLAYTGAVLQMANRRDLVFGKNFFYSDFDNRHSLRNTGIKIVSAIQDYDRMGYELIMALRKFGEEKINHFVPYEIIK